LLIHYGPNKPEYFITQGWKGLPEKNSLTYWTQW
jgi:hypothetical protein